MSRKRNGELDQLVVNGIAGGRTARRDPELTVDRGQMPVDGARADDEMFGDLSIGQALCHQAQHLLLTRGQASRICRWSRQRPCRGRCGYRGWSMCGEGLLWRHSASLSPAGGKGILTEVGACGCNRALIGGMPGRWRGHPKESALFGLCADHCP